MPYILELYKDNLTLNRGEITLFYGLGEDAYRTDEHLLIADALDEQAFPRFGGLRRAYDLIASFPASDDAKLLENLRAYRPEKPLFSGAFFVRSASPSFAKKVADILWDKGQDQSVSPKAASQFSLLRTKKHACLARLLYENRESYAKRANSAYPMNLPISLKPKLARICVNLTGTRSIIVDPFVGVGTTLVEAGLMGIRGLGLDCDYRMIQATQTNLDHFGIENYALKLLDARTIDFPLPYVCSDLPYGKNTRPVHKTLYRDFMAVLARHLQHRAVVILPDHADLSYFGEFTALRIKARFSQYIHGSMTRIIFVLEKVRA